MLDELIEFNRPYMTGKELLYIAEAKANHVLSGDGIFSKRCHAWLERYSEAPRALLTHSCTAALEMSAILLNIQPGDEIITPSFTFVSTANAFVLRGAIPVFVDVRPDTLNLDEALLEAAITPRTRAIVPVHYAGVACEMDTILATAESRGIPVVEDAAQAVFASYRGRPLGSLGAFGTLSFHETKNVICGEGGALLVNDPAMATRAEIIREKGTDRTRFARGEIEKYTWQDIGSSFLPGELVAAFLWAQLEEAESITRRRLVHWGIYHRALAAAEQQGLLQRPNPPPHCTHNAHMYYVLLPEHVDRTAVIAFLRERRINAVFHYVPLHSSPAGRRWGRTHGSLAVTDSIWRRILRLPLWLGMSESKQTYVVETLLAALTSK